MEDDDVELNLRYCSSRLRFLYSSSCYTAKLEKGMK